MAKKGEQGADEDGLTLEERLRRLDEIVSALESGDVELDRGLELFEEGVRHIRNAERVLARAELKVEELVGNEAALRTRALAASGGGAAGGGAAPAEGSDPDAGSPASKSGGEVG
ncbi:MAG: exodeoxyribonuclease VII small subunit [Gemmatimonadota bacterium]